MSDDDDARRADFNAKVEEFLNWTPEDHLNCAARLQVGGCGDSSRLAGHYAMIEAHLQWAQAKRTMGRPGR